MNFDTKQLEELLQDKKATAKLDKKTLEKAKQELISFSKTVNVPHAQADIDSRNPLTRNVLDQHPGLRDALIKISETTSNKSAAVFAKTCIERTNTVTVPEPLPDYDGAQSVVFKHDKTSNKRNKTVNPKEHLSMTITKRHGQTRPPLPFDDRIEVSREHYERLIQTEKKQRAEIEELTTRLSSFASKQLTEGNPNLADLSDRNRPTKIGEKFGELYDDEWSDAFSELQENKFTDKESLALLINSVLMAFGFCQEVAGTQIAEMNQDMEKRIKYPMWTSSKTSQVYQVQKVEVEPHCFSSVSRFVKDCRKSSALGSIPALCTMFKDGKFAEEMKSVDLKKLKYLEVYIDKAVELTWLMCVQDPPMRLEVAKPGTKVDTNLYRFYETKGDVVDMAIWPVVLLHDNGPLISKGFVLPVGKRS